MFFSFSPTSHPSLWCYDVYICLSNGSSPAGAHSETNSVIVILGGPAEPNMFENSCSRPCGREHLWNIQLALDCQRPCRRKCFWTTVFIKVLQTLRAGIFPKTKTFVLLWSKFCGREYFIEKYGLHKSKYKSNLWGTSYDEFVVR